MPCWDSASRIFNAVLDTPFTTVFVANGASGNPPPSRLCALVLVGAGGAGNGAAAGGGGAYLETAFTTKTAAASNTMRIGHGGAVTDVGSTVFGGGREGASRTRYGGGGSAYRNGTSSPNDFVVGGGGAAASSNFASQTGLSAAGGGGGAFSSVAPSSDPSSAGGSTQTTGGAGGVAGGGAGSLGSLPSAGSGGLGAAFLAGLGGGGGGGGGRAAGGGGGNQGTAPNTRGGAGSGGSSFNFDAALTHAGANGYTQASPYTQTNETRGAGDGGLGAGGHGLSVIAWKRCTTVVCPEVPSQLVPPALHICLTETQLQSLVAGAGDPDCDTPPPYLGFRYKGWPFFISRTPPQVAVSRPCDRVPISSDLSAPRWVPTAGYCELVHKATKFEAQTSCVPLCASDCPTTIYFCDEVRAQIGAPPCLSDGRCHFFTHAGCDYLYGGTHQVVNCEPPAPFNPEMGYAGSSAPPCIDGKVPSVFAVGPNVYTGGFQCGASMTLAWDASTVSWVKSSTTPCIGTVGSWSTSMTMGCLYNLTGADPTGCWSNFIDGQTAIPCVCGDSLSDFKGGTVACENAIGRWGITTRGRCDDAQEVPCVPASAPCQCWEMRALWRGAGYDPFTDPVNQSKLISVDPSDIGEPFVTALTITRACAHPTPCCGWVAIDAGDSALCTITIDGCSFVGTGTAAQFAAKINEVLSSAGIVAVGSPDYWLGARWRGSAAFPNDSDCYAGGNNGDNAIVASNTATTAVIACQYSSIWKGGIQVRVDARKGYYPMAYPACVCSDGECYVEADYISTGVLREKPSPANLGELKPLALVSGSEEHCAFFPSPPSVTFPAQIT
jgi:hypothetical protein